MLDKLPVDNQLILDVKYLHPNMRPRKVSAEPICRITSTVCGTLGKAVHSVFGLKKKWTVEELTDLIKAEVDSYQIDSILETYYIKSSE